MIRTHVGWAANTPTTEQLSQIGIHIQQLVEDSKTDGEYIVVEDPNSPNLLVVERSWVDTDSADQWIAYISTFGPVFTRIVS
jgi:hypothetical protein